MRGQNVADVWNYWLNFYELAYIASQRSDWWFRSNFIFFLTLNEGQQTLENFDAMEMTFALFIVLIKKTNAHDKNSSDLARRVINPNVIKIWVSST